MVGSDGPEAEAAGNENDITLLALVGAVMRKWTLILASIVCMVALCILYLFVATPKYEAHMVVRPADDQSLGSQLSSIGQVSGIGSFLASGNLFGNRTSTTFSVYLNLLHSRVLCDRLMAEADLLRKLQPQLWDDDSNDWVRPSGPIFAILATMRTIAGVPEWTPPSGGTLAEYLEGTLRVSQLEDTGLYEVTFRHEDASLALRTLELVSATADAMIKAQFLQRTTTEVDYLTERLNEVNVAEHRRAIAEILGEKERALLMASIDAPFVVDVVELPVVSDAPVTPALVLILALGVFGGVVLGGFVALLATHQAKPS